MSNLKQFGTSLTMYSQDYDEKWVPAAGADGLRWPQKLQTYIKAREIAYCPSANYNLSYVDAAISPDSFAIRDPNGPDYDYLYGLYPSYGYNWMFLAPDPACPGEPTNSASISGQTIKCDGTVTVTTTNSLGRSLSTVQSPASTVALVDSGSMLSNGQFTWSVTGQPSVGYFRVNPPLGNLWSNAIPLASESYGRVWPRHLEMTNVLFADGHAKAMKIDALRDASIWDAS